ncbi:NAD(P)/FAD-dependent oxidoreductase [Nocardioides mesophilus]|uniref:FAD-dependent oxidoreductase n=1 Tax=Nocardioides mesophilus TaxID=433659 RepID=A0A7G9RG95_9ACTN|nr:FAD-dependent oxidoreductase [Nocardioides mesophilus]QNN54620.1 FAD-dependent oxidoreductase [Nocardioides mesophilus]
MSADTGPLVVVGGGLAGAKAVEAARAAGFGGEVVLVGAEPHLPYERPPLSKDYLMGKAPFEDAVVHDEGWYAAHQVDLRRGVTVTALDLERHEVRIGAESLRYERLLLATGAVPRRLAMADSSGAPVAYLRSVDDSDRLRAALRPEARIVVVGGGWIGLEVAAAARNAGAQVTVVEPLELPLLRVLGPEVARIFAALHRSQGVDLRLATSMEGVAAAGAGAAVRLGDGSTLEADLVVVGIGVVPDTALASEAGLEVDNGIVVDEHLRTSHPDVFAAGDVASAWHPLLRQRVRVEHWDNAVEQGTAAGRNLAGESVAYDRMPYFFTDQYDLGMEYVGHVGAQGYDAVVVRGEPSAGSDPFTAFWLREGRVLAGMQANDWDATDAIRALVGRSVDVPSLQDTSVPLSELADGA